MKHNVLVVKEGFQGRAFLYIEGVHVMLLPFWNPLVIAGLSNNVRCLLDKSNNAGSIRIQLLDRFIGRIECVKP